MHIAGFFVSQIVVVAASDSNQFNVGVCCNVVLAIMKMHIAYTLKTVSRNNM